ncbi:MAG: hypothetical protein GEU99_10425 [Luteitalea sp.]|nr:hypothetical protein [Luteitalea sp.]
MKHALWLLLLLSIPFGTLHGQDDVSNINARYMVESVDMSGVAEAEVSLELRNDMQAMVGQRLDPDAADRLEERLSRELPDYEVNRRIERGSERGRIRMVFEAQKKPWIPFRPSRSMLAYHSKQGWSSVLDIDWTARRNHRFSLGLVFWNEQDLIEDYAGFWLRYENRFAGTERLGLSIELSSFREKWEDATLRALESRPDGPEAYRARQMIEPAVTFALSPRFRIRAGASIGELESHSQSPGSQALGPSTRYTLQFDESGPTAWADPDLVKGILTNLFENAAEAAAAGGTVLATAGVANGFVNIEVHDSGPGLGDEVLRTFEPTITFKKHGMGLGLSIARKNALLSGGDIQPVVSVLGGAAFRVVLPQAEARSSAPASSISGSSRS